MAQEADRALPRRVVVDANVALKLVIAQEDSDTAQALFESLALDDRAQISAPDFFLAECASVLTLYHRKRLLSADDVRKSVKDLRSLGLSFVSADLLILEAVELSLRQNLAGYDSFYGALALRLGQPLITADEGLVRALAGSRVRAILLKSLRNP